MQLTELSMEGLLSSPFKIEKESKRLPFLALSLTLSHTNSLSLCIVLCLSFLLIFYVVSFSPFVLTLTQAHLRTNTLTCLDTHLARTNAHFVLHTTHTPAFCLTRMLMLSVTHRRAMSSPLFLTQTVSLTHTHSPLSPLSPLSRHTRRSLFQRETLALLEN